MIKLTELALNNGAIVMDELMPSQTEIVFNTSQLQAFADEYLALSSSEPEKSYEQERGEIACEHLDNVISWLKERGLYDSVDYQHEGTDFSEILTSHENELLNPLNQQLLTERNECVEEIKRLHKILKNVSNNSSTITSNNIFQALKETSTSIQKLLGE
jgi:transcriptional regulator of acetoin/glycerol metabolism